MSSRWLLFVVAMVAFGLGVGTHRWWSVKAPDPFENLSWEVAGQKLRLTSRAQGESYFLLGVAAARPGNAAGRLVPSGQAFDIASPTVVYRLSSTTLLCEPPLECNPCRSAKDCLPVPPPPPPFDSGLWVSLESFDPR